jgi:hypothetical protein
VLLAANTAAQGIFLYQILACPKCEGPEIQKKTFFLNIFTHVAAPFLADEQAHMFDSHYV